MSGATRRIIFVPGMKPKPPPEIHRPELIRCLSAALRRSNPEAARLFRDGHCEFTLISWTHRFYGSYRDIALDRAGIDRIILRPTPTAEDIREIESPAHKLSRLMHLLGDATPLVGRLIARPEMRSTMAEARRYLGDVGGIATEIREQLMVPLQEAWAAGQRVLVIGHSMGSVIAYDTFWVLAHQRHDSHRVDLFMTLGSPLASRLIREGLRGRGLDGIQRYPTNIRRWVNLAARGEMTALRPRLKPYFGEMLELGILESFEDHVGIYNHFRGDLGVNVHKAYGYLTNGAVSRAIADWLIEDA
ncbi:MAG TPA: hypothetical protein VGC50_00170 [Gammaproteobacteria bacterium]